MNAPNLNNSVTASDAALKRVAEILADDKENLALRIAVEGGGCSGFSYTFDLTGEIAGDDLILEGHGGKIVIDELSLVYMGGSEIDYVDNLMGQAFQVNNPNAVASCGCGTSFSI